MTELLKHFSLSSVVERCHPTSCRLQLILRMLVIIVITTLIAYQSPLSFYMWSHDQPSGLIKYRLRVQNSSTFHFLKFLDLIKLTQFCERISTIECLTYLNQNQSDYLQPQSPDEINIFKETYCMEQKKILFHTFWGNTRRLNHPFLHLHIRSFLYTQNQQCSRMIVWLLPPLDPKINQAYNMLYAPNVEFRTLISFTEELRQVGVYIGSHWTGLPWRWLLPPRALFSDVARFLILHKFGGIYIDVDSLFLRDLQPLFEHEFAYRWSILDAFNTGILRLFAQSNISSIIIDRAHKSKSPYEFFPSSIHKYSLPVSFHRLPSALFDPIWLAVDEGDKPSKQIWKLTRGFLQGFKDPSLQHSEISRRGRAAFDGAFTFHWHSSSALKIYEHGSYLHQWSEFLNAQIYDT